MRAEGQPVPTQSDLEKISEEVAGKVSPIKWATDKLVEELAKKYLPRAAVLLAAINSVPAEALLAFLWPSRIASGWDELRATNADLNNEGGI
jgi:hypothetical protein